MDLPHRLVVSGPVGFQYPRTVTGCLAISTPVLSVTNWPVEILPYGFWTYSGFLDFAPCR